MVVRFFPSALLVLLSATSVVALTGPTLVAKSRSGLAWVGVGCQVAVLNITKLKDSELVALATSGNISEGCISPVNAIGISFDGQSALVAAGSSELTLLKLEGSEMSSTRGPVVSGSVGRLSNAEVYGGVDVYFAATSSADAGFVVAATVESVTSVVQLNTTGTYDVQPRVDDYSSLVATRQGGLVFLSFVGGQLVVEEYAADGSVGNDGLALSEGRAFVAAQADGLVVIDLTTGLPAGGAPVEGWSGGVGLGGGMALVAADPGLVAFDVSDEGVPPVKAWECLMGGGGTGWNVDVDAGRCLALVADYDAGLQVVRYCEDGSAVAPEIVAHFGDGAMQDCEGSR